MLINLHTLLHLSVLTESGVKLGRVYDINFDIDSQCIKSYKVRASILSTHYLIKPAQVVSITAKQMTVDDAIIQDKQKQKEKKDQPSVVPEMAMSKLDIEVEK